jgi:hypothetical protein
MKLAELLQTAGFRRVALSRTAAGHFELAGTLNGHSVRVLVDTGAARTVASLQRVRELGLSAHPLARCGAGAGGSALQVFQVEGAELCLDGFPPKLAALLMLGRAINDAPLMQVFALILPFFAGLLLIEVHWSVALSLGAISLAFVVKMVVETLRGHDDGDN